MIPGKKGRPACKFNSKMTKEYEILSRSHLLIHNFKCHGPAEFNCQEES